MKYFIDKNLKHHTFKMAAAQELTDYHIINLCKTRQLEKPSVTEDTLHTMVNLPNSRNCYYCWHGYSTPQTNRKSTTFKSIQCNVPLWKPSIVCTPSPPFCWGDWTSYQIFKEPPGLTGPQLWEGVAGKEGVTFFRWGRGVAIFTKKTKLKPEIFNDKKSL